MIDEELMSDLLGQWEDRFDQGVDTPARELCRDRPELAGLLAERIAALKRMRNRMKAESRPHGTGADAGAEESRDEPGRSPSSERYAGEVPIPGFRLIGRIGSGAFGEVWKASSGRKNYAIKFFHGDLHAPDSRGRIMRELEGLTRIMEVGHDLILKIVSLKMKEGTLVLVTELADLSLEKLFVRIRHGFPLVQRCAYALGLLQSVAEALDHLQARHGLLHLDIKPANLLLVRGICKIGDFGTVSHFRSGQPPAGEVLLSLPSSDGPDDEGRVRVAPLVAAPQERAFGGGATLVTAAGVFTPRFAPPEAFRGKTSRSFDQYSLALTFCELVAGRIPFEGESQFARRIEGRMEAEFLPEPLRGVIGRALAPEPERRFSSCGRFISALRAALNPLVERDVLDHDWAGWLLGMEAAAGTESPAMTPAPASGRFDRGKAKTAENMKAAGTDSPVTASGWVGRRKTKADERILALLLAVTNCGLRSAAFVADKIGGSFWGCVRYIRNSSVMPILSLVAVVLMCLALVSVHKRWIVGLSTNEPGEKPKEEKKNQFAFPLSGGPK